MGNCGGGLGQGRGVKGGHGRGQDREMQGERREDKH